MVRRMYEKEIKSDGCYRGYSIFQRVPPDNIVYRKVFLHAVSNRLVSHKHITIGWTGGEHPVLSVRPGQIVGVREKDKSMKIITESLSGYNHSKYPWIEWDSASLSGKLIHVPDREEIPENIKEQLIVELYSK